MGEGDGDQCIDKGRQIWKEGDKSRRDLREKFQPSHFLTLPSSTSSFSFSFSLPLTHTRMHSFLLKHSLIEQTKIIIMIISFQYRPGLQNLNKYMKQKKKKEKKMNKWNIQECLPPKKQMHTSGKFADIKIRIFGCYFTKYSFHKMIWKKQKERDERRKHEIKQVCYFFFLGGGASFFLFFFKFHFTNMFYGQISSHLLKFKTITIQDCSLQLRKSSFQIRILFFPLLLKQCS